MRYINKLILVGILTLSAVLGAQATSHKTRLYPYNKGINIIPKPKVMKVDPQWGQPNCSKFTVLQSSSSIFYDGVESKVIAQFFYDKFTRAFAQQLEPSMYRLKPAPKPDSEDWSGTHISFSIDSTLKLNDEGYTLEVKSSNVKVVGKTARGLFWGMQTLLQLFPAEIERKYALGNMETPLLYLPIISIEDEPAFAYRGMHLDPSRHFATAEEVKRHIDVISMFKINKLHWHLTDDQGWRIEIKKYPRLTEIGSKRTPVPGIATDGYYTQEEVKDIVAYAKARHVDIIPEIEMPGHAMGAIVAYPELACNPKTQKGSDYKIRDLWGVEQDVFCAGKEHTFQFISDVIDEVAPLFPSEYFHVGGDECPKIRWKTCPYCQKRIKDNSLKDEHELQSYVIRRAQKMLEKHGKKLIGWEEILEGGLAPSATVMSWIGEQSGIKSANMGHDVIMTPGSGGMYIDFYQGDPKIEPVALCCYIPLSHTYAYYPIPDKIAPDKRHHILGAQVNVWSEYLYTDALRQYRAYPRTLALAEAVWTPRDQKDFTDFSRRLNNAYVRLDQLGINYHIPQPEQPHGSLNFVAFTDSTNLVLKTTRPITMVYTTDGSDPTTDEGRPTGVTKEYTTPIAIRNSGVIKVASALPSGKLSPVRSIIFERQKLSPSTPLAKVKPGLKTKTSIGDYMQAADFAGAKNWTNGYIDSLKRLIPDRLKNNLDEIQRKAVVAEGYVKIPRDGVYVFSTNNDEFWIDGEKLIDNAGEVKKYSRRDKSRALKAGYHPIKIVFVGAVHGGFPSYWDNGAVQMRNIDEPNFIDIQPFTAVSSKKK